jgi:hypothetical protein
MQSQSIRAPRAVIRSFYAISDRCLLIEAHDPAAAGIFTSLFERWYYEKTRTEEALVGDVSVIIEDPASPRPTIPDDFLSFALPGDGTCHSDGDDLLLEFGGCLILLDARAPREARVWVEKGLNETSAAAANVVSFAVSAVLRRCGVYEIHSGAFREPSCGRSGLIIGPSGSGKSTLTLQLAAQGWGYLSDDALLLNDTSDGVKARGVRRDFAITAETLAASGVSGAQLQCTVPDTYDSSKQRLSPRELFPAGFVESCVPTSLIFSELTNDRETRIERLSRSQSMARLIRMCPWASYDKISAEDHLGLLARLARQASGFALYAGRDLLLDTGRASRLISSLI